MNVNKIQILFEKKERKNPHISSGSISMEFITRVCQIEIDLTFNGSIIKIYFHRVQICERRRFFASHGIVKRLLLLPHRFLVLSSVKGKIAYSINILYRIFYPLTPAYFLVGKKTTEPSFPPALLLLENAICMQCALNIY